jgi:ribosome-binding protein aMBF1 (putative translation factor)
MTMASKELRAVEVGQRIALARKEAGGMSQEELATLLGVSPRSIQAWEAGDVIPYRYVRELEKYLERSAAWILHGEAAAVEDEHLDRVLGELADVKRQLAAILKVCRETRAAVVAA